MKLKNAKIVHTGNLIRQMIYAFRPSVHASQEYIPRACCPMSAKKRAPEGSGINSMIEIWLFSIIRVLYIVTACFRYMTEES